MQVAHYERSDIDVERFRHHRNLGGPSEKPNPSWSSAMTAVGALAGLDSAWMVSMLFGSGSEKSGTDKTSTPSSAAPTVSSVSNGPTAALKSAIVEASLNSQGAPTTPEATADDMNATVAAGTAMTSAEITQAFYSGQGAPMLGGTGSRVYQTFETYLSDMKMYADAAREDGKRYQKFADNPDQAAAFLGPLASTLSSEDWSAMSANSSGDAEFLDKMYADLSAAFAAKTLQFQAAADVPELHYSNTTHYSQSGSNITFSGNYTVDTSSLNSVNDGKNHTIMGENTGQVIYLTW